MKQNHFVFDVESIGLHGEGFAVGWVVLGGDGNRLEIGLWPVEAKFLAQCVDDHHAEREWQGPYLLHDVASVRMAAGLNPLDKTERLEGEFPEHDPCADARQSARLLMEALSLIRPIKSTMPL